MRQQKTNSTRQPNFLKRHARLSIILFLILVAVGGLFVYEKVALELNKRAFTQARAAIDTVYADIVAQVGQPDNYRRTNICSRPNQEFGEGPLSCDVSTSFVYGVTNKVASDALKNEIEVIISQHSNAFTKSMAPKSFISVTPAPASDADSSNDYYNTKDGMECTVKYTYDMFNEIQLHISDSSKKIFGASFGCSDNARAQYYSIN